MSETVCGHHRLARRPRQGESSALQGFLKHTMAPFRNALGSLIAPSFLKVSSAKKSSAYPSHGPYCPLPSNDSPMVNQGDDRCFPITWAYDGFSNQPLIPLCFFHPHTPRSLKPELRSRRFSDAGTIELRTFSRWS